MTGVLYGAFVVLLGAVALCAPPYCHLLAIYLLRGRRRRAAERALLSAPLPPAEALPRVLVQLPIHNEPRVIARSLGAIAALRWPRHKLEIQVLDDSTDETSAIALATARALEAAGARIEIVRRRTRAGFKAGALQYGLERSDAPYVAIFDADYVPPADWLQRAMAPMLADDKIAFVQTRIDYLNRDQNWLTRAQALTLDSYYAFEQPARAWCGLPNRFNGTCGLWRRRAIDAAGGWSAATLAEDLDISYRVQGLGWRTEFLVSVSAPGELPADWGAWKTQQYRWTKGTAEAVLKTLRTLLPRLGGWRRLALVAIAATETLLLPMAALTVAVGLALLAVSGRFHPELTAPVLAVIALHVVARIGGVVLSRHVLPRGRRGRLLGELGAALAFELSLTALRIRAAASALAGRKSGFVRTRKRGA